jgi:N-acetylglucosaminyldiphosphoundecaprenol N-acetyl-beta-D-mannosaminyltransferase
MAMLRQMVVSTPFSVLSRRGVIEALGQMARAGANGYVCVYNVHTTMMGFWDERYRRISEGAALVVPDGVPIVWAMRSLGAKEQDRVRGPSLMRDMVSEGRAWGARHFLYGGSPRALEALKAYLEVTYPGCQIVGSHSPPFRPLEQISEEEWQASAQLINSAQPHFVWVGLGAPKQELWMWNQRDRVKGVMLGIGAAFDLLPGVVPEAPARMQKLGLEWLYRLYQEPRRMWRRYVINNPLFLVLWGWQWVRGRC